MSTAAPLTAAVPGDKSLSHRALMFAALAAGESHVTNILDSEDVRSTAECLRRLGAQIPDVSGEMKIVGGGVRALRDPDADLDCGNSGTSARLLAGLVAGAGRTARFVGDRSLSRRPMLRIAEPLRMMGARIEFEEGDGLPMRVIGAPLSAIDFTSMTASAQVKSAVLLAAYAARVEAIVREPERSRDHTERMLAALGVAVESQDRFVKLAANAPDIQGFEFDVPGDPSSAAYFAAWAVLAQRAVRTSPIALNPTRTGFLALLGTSGARIAYEDEHVRCGEPVGRIVVNGSLDAPFVVERSAVPAMIDELPLVGCLAAYAPGETRVRGATELRVKESDRISTLVSNLQAVGADAEELPDGFVVRGRPGPLRGTVVTNADHRIAMAFGVLGAMPGNEIVIDNPACVAVSFPGFWDALAALERGAP